MSGLDAAAVAETLLEASERGASAVAAVVVGADAPTAGARLLLVREPAGAGEDVRGTLGDEALDRVAADTARAALDDPRSTDGLRVVEVGANSVELYLEIRRAVQELVIVGAGHIAVPLAHIGALLGFRVTVLDDRPDFATPERFPDAERVVRADFSDPFRDVPIHERSHLLLVTRGHRYDYDCLVRALRMDPLPAYIGMIGSRRRVRATFVQLLDDGIPRERLRVIHAPVGLDVGAETPEEIAVAVAAELVMVRRGGTGSALKDVERIADRFFQEETA